MTVPDDITAAGALLTRWQTEEPAIRGHQVGGAKALRHHPATRVRLVLWEGACEVHERFTAREVASLREDHAGIRVLENDAIRVRQLLPLVAL